MASLISRLRAAWRAFEGAQASPQHLGRPVNAAQSPDAATEMAGANLLQWGRHLDENHDLAIGVIDDLVTNVVGTGIQVEPLPEVAGRVSPDLSDQILDLWEEWSRAPEVTGELPLGELQRLTCRAWLRDGEFFAQHVDALAPYPYADGDVRYRIEYLESEMVPRDLYVEDDRYRQGIWFNQWNAPALYAVYLTHPDDFVTNSATRFGTLADVKRVPADRMLHCKFARRWPQTRGIPITHGIIRRLQDLKEYEDSERIAARVAASLSAYIRKSPDNAPPQDPNNNVSGEREMRMQSGIIFDNLLPGEEIGTIDSSRPNPELGNFRAQMIRALAAGTGSRYSSIARDYNGTYSAQRQELVESRPHYLRLRDFYVQKFLRPVYERFVTQAWLQNMLDVPKTVMLRDVLRAEFVGPGMPWIDPLKEVQADVMLIENSLATREQVIRFRGGDPRKVEARETQPNLTVIDGDDSEEDEDSEAM